MTAPIVSILHVTDNTLVNDDITFVLNPALIDPRLIPELQLSSSLVEDEFKFDVKSDPQTGTAQVYVSTSYAPVTSSQNYEVFVSTPIYRRSVFESLYNDQFVEFTQASNDEAEDAG